MRRIFLILALGLSFTFVLNGCKSDDDNNYTDYDTIAETFDYENANFIYDEKKDEFYFSEYFYEGDFKLYPGDVVLTYLEVGWDATEKLPLWQQLPVTVGYKEGSTQHVMNFSSVFTEKYFEVIAWDGTQNPVALNGITFRVVVIPSNLMATRSSDIVDTKDYNAVIKHYNIDESKIKRFENKSSKQRAN